MGTPGYGKLSAKIAVPAVLECSGRGYVGTATGFLPGLCYHERQRTLGSFVVSYDRLMPYSVFVF